MLLLVNFQNYNAFSLYLGTIHEQFIITVDGPSGAGKGTLCHALAEN
ncbi:cytidylate kinase [Actinobacillus equuli]|nr:cytidylate kinase [Actinobacillus equuli]